MLGSTLSPDIRVVEPFLRRSVLGINLNALENNQDDDNSVRLSDIVDIARWEDIAKDKKLSSQTTWEHFIKDAPRKLILVFKTTDGPIFHNSIASFAEQYDFKIVRNISVEDKILQKDYFKKLIYGDNVPHNVVVIFKRWGGS